MKCKIRTYYKDNNGFYRDACLPTEIETKSLHGAKIKAHTRARKLGFTPHTRQWIPRLTFIRKPLAARFYQNAAGNLRLVVIGKD